jgi:hypothetical protein
VTELALGQLQPVGGGAARTLWSFTSSASLAEILCDDTFLGRHFAHSVVVGDQVLFSCGSNGTQVHGTLAVVGVWPGSGESSGAGRVTVELLCTTGRFRTPAAKLAAVS